MLIICMCHREKERVNRLILIIKIFSRSLGSFKKKIIYNFLLEIRLVKVIIKIIDIDNIFVNIMNIYYICVIRL